MVADRGTREPASQGFRTPAQSTIHRCRHLARCEARSWPARPRCVHGHSLGPFDAMAKKRDARLGSSTKIHRGAGHGSRRDPSRDRTPGSYHIRLKMTTAQARSLGRTDHVWPIAALGDEFCVWKFVPKMVSVALPLSGAFGLEMKLATGAAIILGNTCQARCGHQHACADALVRPRSGSRGVRLRMRRWSKPSCVNTDPLTNVTPPTCRVVHDCALRIAPSSEHWMVVDEVQKLVPQLATRLARPRVAVGVQSVSSNDHPRIVTLSPPVWAKLAGAVAVATGFERDAAWGIVNAASSPTSHIALTRRAHGSLKRLQIQPRRRTPSVAKLV